MRDWKYIMVQVGDHRYPILFPQELVHRHVAQGIERAIALDRDFRGKGFPEVVSAGFVSGVSVVKAFGESESLGIKAHPDDAVRINNDMLRHQDPEPEPVQEPQFPKFNERLRRSYTEELAERRRQSRLAQRTKK